MKNHLDRKKLIKLVSFLWLLISVIISSDFSDENYYDNYDNGLFSFAFLSSPVWVIYLYMWLFNAVNIHTIVSVLYVAAIFVLFPYEAHAYETLLLFMPAIHIWLLILFRLEQKNTGALMFLSSALTLIKKQLGDSNELKINHNKYGSRLFIQKISWSLLAFLAAFTVSSIYFGWTRDLLNEKLGSGTVTYGSIIASYSAMYAIWAKNKTFQQHRVLALFIAGISGVLFYDIVPNILAIIINFLMKKIVIDPLTLFSYLPILFLFGVSLICASCAFSRALYNYLTIQK